MEPIAVGSLGAGSDKGETGWHLPLRLYRLCVVLVRWSCGSFVAFCCWRWSFVAAALAALVCL